MSTVPFSTRVTSRASTGNGSAKSLSPSRSSVSAGRAALSPALCAAPPARIRMVSTAPPLSASRPAWNGATLTSGWGSMVTRSAKTSASVVVPAGVLPLPSNTSLPMMLPPILVELVSGAGIVGPDFRGISGDDRVGQRGVAGEDPAVGVGAVAGHGCVACKGRVAGKEAAAVPACRVSAQG